MGNPNTIKGHKLHASTSHWGQCFLEYLFQDLIVALEKRCVLAKSNLFSDMCLVFFNHTALA